MKTDTENVDQPTAATTSRRNFIPTGLAAFNMMAMLGGFQEMDIDFTADNPGLSLFHCHMQLHMDFGFMALFDYV